MTLYTANGDEARLLRILSGRMDERLAELGQRIEQRLAAIEQIIERVQIDLEDVFAWRAR